MMIKFYKNTLTILVCTLGIIPSHQAIAKDAAPVPLVVHASTSQEMPKETTHSILRLTPDKSELIRLEVPAKSIIIGNPAHINIIADSPTTLVIVPRTPGATHFTILGSNGEIIMQRHVIVASPKEDYLKIKRTCTEDNCQETSVFYCPDMCHEIKLDTEQTSGSNGGASEKTNNNKNSAADIDAGKILNEEIE